MTSTDVRRGSRPSTSHFAFGRTQSNISGQSDPVLSELQPVSVQSEFQWSPPLPKGDPGSSVSSSPWSQTIKLAEPFISKSSDDAKPKSHICILCLDDLKAAKSKSWERAAYRFGNDISNLKQHIRRHHEAVWHEKFSNKRPHHSQSVPSQSVALSKYFSNPSVKSRQGILSISPDVKAIFDLMFVRLLVDAGLPFSISSHESFLKFVGDSVCGLLPGYVPPKHFRITTLLSQEWDEFIKAVQSVVNHVFEKNCRHPFLTLIHDMCTFSSKDSMLGQSRVSFEILV